jgi:hypothetical protein
MENGNGRQNTTRQARFFIGVGGGSKSASSHALLWGGLLAGR